MKYIFDKETLTTVSSTAATVAIGSALAVNAVPALATAGVILGGAVAVGALYAKLSAESEEANEKSSVSSAKNEPPET